MKSYSLLIILFAVTFINSCKKEEKSDNSEIVVTDIDGNLYHTVKIGSQIWMVENLKTTRFNDGEAIPLIEDNYQWSNSTSFARCFYLNEESSYKPTYGALYNWYAVNSGKLCPKGWHVPSDAEWTTLCNYLGGDSIAGEKLKESGHDHWKDMGVDATNESGFTALPGGTRYFNGGFDYIRYQGVWWSSTKLNATSSAWVRELDTDTRSVKRCYYFKVDGISVRCIKD